MMNRHGPLLGCLLQRQKQQFHGGFFVGKSATDFDDLAQRPVQRFHAVSGVDGAPNVRRVMEKRRDPRPVPPPHLAHTGISFPTTVRLKLEQNQLISVFA